MIKSLPPIMSESGERGRQWGEKIGRDSMIEVLQEHPELRKAIEASKSPLPR